MTMRSRYLLINLGVSLIFAATSLVWLPSSNLVVAPENVYDFGRIVLMLLACYGVAHAVVRRFETDPSPIAGFIRHLGDGLRILVRAAGVFVPFGAASGLFMYLSSSTTRPLMDAQFAAIDAAMGFHWLSFLDFLNGYPWLAKVLVLAYHTTGLMVVGVCICLSFLRREQRVFEFLALLALASLVTGILMTLFPAAGAYAWFQPAPERYSSFTTQAGMWHHAELMALRSGETFVYLAAKNSGLVTFPSFHTVMGILTTYAMRQVRFLFPLVAAVNACMIAATMPEGGHHFIDVVAGALIAVGSIVAVRRLAGPTEQA